MRCVQYLIGWSVAVAPAWAQLVDLPADTLQQAPSLEAPVAIPIPPDPKGLMSEPEPAPVASPASLKPAATQPTAAPAPVLLKSGLASWYGPRFHGRRTASGERYDMHALTAAHKYLPFGTLITVRSVHTGQSVVVRVNDRGPYKHQRILDLSRAAMDALGVLGRGVTQVEVWVEAQLVDDLQALGERWRQRQVVRPTKHAAGKLKTAPRRQRR
jgi:rare lipoprotein A